MTMPNSNSRKVVAEKLGALLADTYTLAFKTHGYHWNVVGPQFHDLHKLFEEQYGELYAAADDIAERIRALGEPAPSSYDALLKLATVKADGAPGTQAQLVERLRDAHLQVAKTAYETVELAEQHGDVASADVATQHVTDREKAAWMLGSILA